MLLEHDVELERGPVARVETPPDPAVNDPLLHPADVVVVESKAPPDRLAVGEIEQLGGGDPIVGELEQQRDDAEHGVRLTQAPIGEAHPEVGQAPALGGRITVLVVLVAASAGSERGLDERRDRLDVRAHDDHVARLERRVTLEQVEDRVTDHLDLTRTAVAGVDLEAVIVVAEQCPCIFLAGKRRPGRRGVDADPGLDPLQQGPLRVGDRVMMVGPAAVRRQDKLELPRVLAPTREQPVRGQRGGRVGSPASHRGGLLRQLRPQGRRRMEHEQMDIPRVRERIEHPEMAAGQTSEAEQREPIAGARRSRVPSSDARTLY